VSLEKITIHEHCRMEEGRAKERMPAQRYSSTRKSMHPPVCSPRIEVDDRAPDDGEIGLGGDPRELTFEPLRHRNVVGIESGHIAADGPIQPAVQRRSEAHVLLVAEYDESVVVEASSTTMSSRSVSDCARTLAIASRRKRASS
jgi:hypothetical protein